MKNKKRSQIITFATIIAIYFLSCLGSYKYIQKSHYHPSGRWYGLKPAVSDIVYTFIPITNTFPSISYLCGGWKYKDNRIKPRKETNFFEPKKDN